MALQDYYTSGSAGYVTMSSSSIWTGQIFLTGAAYTISSVTLLLYRQSTPGIVTVSIRASNGSVPQGGDLCVGTIDGDALTTDSAGEQKSITFSVPYALSDATYYAIVVRPSAGLLRWKGDNIGSYPDGDNVYSFNSGSTWTTNAGVNAHWFETYGSSPAPSKATSPTPSDTATGQSINLASLDWTMGVGADYENVYFGPSGNMSQVDVANVSETFSLADYLPLSYNTTYQWRIDSVNDNGTTTGDTWSFTTLSFAPPSPSTGQQQKKRLVACAENRFWYENI